MDGDALTTNQKGAIAEAAITKEAVRLGIEVYRPVAEGGRCNMILDLPSGLSRVQVKWAARIGEVIRVHLCSSSRAPCGGFIRRPYNNDEIDAIAAYRAELDNCYLMPMSAIPGCQLMYLRLSPTKNRQRVGVHLAEQYEFGAIAQLGERLHGMQEVAGSSPASST
jgi:PD-(D/E)XK nuclease superfamily protein